MSTTYRVLAILLCLNVRGAVMASDACDKVVPSSLRALLARRFPEYRVSREVDTHGPCVEDRKRSNENMCLLATRGDFDGDGRQDFAVLMPSRTASAPPTLIVALRRRRTWKIEQLKVGTDRAVHHFVISTLHSGMYRETPAVRRADETQRVVRSRCNGVAMSACDTWTNGYFREDSKWEGIRLSD